MSEQEQRACIQWLMGSLVAMLQMRADIKLWLMFVFRLSFPTEPGVIGGGGGE